MKYGVLDLIQNNLCKQWSWDIFKIKLAMSEWFLQQGNGTQKFIETFFPQLFVCLKFLKIKYLNTHTRACTPIKFKITVRVYIKR